MNLVILVKGAQGVELPSVAPKEKGGKLVKPGFHPQKLAPGENDVDSDYWNEVKGNPAVKQWLACKILTNQGEGKARPMIESLDSLNTDVALRHIARCENIQVLNDWKSTTKNASYKKEIETRIMALVAAQTGDVPSTTESTG